MLTTVGSCTYANCQHTAKHSEVAVTTAKLPLAANSGSIYRGLETKDVRYKLSHLRGVPGGGASLIEGDRV